jgi:hypothetical protein
VRSAKGARWPALGVGCRARGKEVKAKTVVGGETRREGETRRGRDGTELNEQGSIHCLSTYMSMAYCHTLSQTLYPEHMLRACLMYHPL